MTGTRRVARQFGVPLLLEASREVAGALPRARFEHTADAIRTMQLGWGEAELRDNAIVWASKAGPATTVRITVVDDHTRIVVHRDVRTVLIGLGVGGLIAGLVGLLVAALLWGGLHSPMRMLTAMIMAATAGGYPLARMQASAEVKKQTGVIERLADRVASEIRGAVQ